MIPTSKKKLALQILGLVAIFALAFSLARYVGSEGQLQALVANYGYLGAFILAMISGFNLVLPIPTIAFMPLFLSVGLNFWITIVIITTGMLIADILTYYLGRVGIATFSTFSRSGNKFLEKLEQFRARHQFSPVLTVFLFASFVPLPNEVLLIPMGVIGYSLKKVFMPLFAGNLIFNALYSSGVINLFELLN